MLASFRLESPTTLRRHKLGMEELPSFRIRRPPPLSFSALQLWPPGTLNNLNILDRSPLFDKDVRGEAPLVNFAVIGNEYK